MCAIVVVFSTEINSSLLTTLTPDLVCLPPSRHIVCLRGLDHLRSSSVGD